MAAKGPSEGRLNGHKRLVPRSGRPAPVRATPAPDPRVAAAAAGSRSRRNPEVAAAGRRAGLTLAVVGVLWIVVTEIGRTYGWTQRAMALVDLFALAGFGFALYLTWQVWRLRRPDKG